jgi:hypothetical protein
MMMVMFYDEKDWDMQRQEKEHCICRVIDSVIGE